MEILEFRFLTIDDETDNRYNHWSRIYEYSTVLNKIKNLVKQNNLDNNVTIHNTCWGFDKGDHTSFLNHLNNLLE